MPILSEKQSKTSYYFLIPLLAIFSLLFLYLAQLNLVSALGFTLFVSITIIIYQKPEIGIFLILLSLLGGQLLRLNFGNDDNGILISDLIVPFFILVWFLRTIIKREKIIFGFSGFLLFLFLFIAVISMANGLRFLEQNQIVSSIFYLIRLLSYAGLLFASASIFSQNEKGIKKCGAVLIFTFFLFALAGLLQIIYFPDLTVWAVRYGWDPHIGRLFSTFLDPNFAGAFLVIGFIFSLALLYYTKSIETKIFLALTSIITLTATILTYSRSSYLFLFISFLVLSILRSKKLLLIGIAAIIILLLIFPRSLERIEGGFSIDESAKNRFDSWEKTLNIVRDYPLLGVGYNAFRPAQERYSFIKPNEQNIRSNTGSDSSILTIMATTGVTGTLIYLLFYLTSIIKAKKVFNFSPVKIKRGFGLALVSILIGLLFHSIFVNSLLYPAIMAPLFISLGIISTKYS